MAFGQLVMSVQCCAEAPASVPHFLLLLYLRVFAMGSWIDNGFPGSRWVFGFMMGSWIHDGFLNSRWVPGFTIGSWIRDRFLDSR